MRKALLLIVLVTLLTPAVATGAGGSRLAGTWKGTMRPTGSGVSSSYGFRITIDADGRSGTWRTERCRGTLTFVKRMNGFALFRERRTSGPCTGKGTDRVKRSGSRLVVSFRSAAGRAFDSRGTLSKG